MGVYQFKRLKQNKDMYLTYLERLLLKENASPGHLCVTVTRCDPFALEEGAPGLVVHKTPSWRGCPAQPSSWKHSELLTGAQAGWPWAGTAWGCAPAAEPDPGGCCVLCPTHSSDFFVGLQKHEPNPSPALGHTCSAPGVLELLGRLGEVSANESHQQHRSGQTHGDSHRLEIWGLCLTWNQINIEQTAPELSQ